MTRSTIYKCNECSSKIEASTLPIDWISIEYELGGDKDWVHFCSYACMIEYLDTILKDQMRPRSVTKVG